MFQVVLSLCSFIGLGMAAITTERRYAKYLIVHLLILVVVLAYYIFVAIRLSLFDGLFKWKHHTLPFREFTKSSYLVIHSENVDVIKSKLPFQYLFVSVMMVIERSLSFRLCLIIYLQIFEAICCFLFLVSYYISCFIRIVHFGYEATKFTSNSEKSPSTNIPLLAPSAPPMV